MGMGKWFAIPLWQRVMLGLVVGTAIGLSLRYTMGAEAASELATDWFKPLGEARREHRYPHTDEGFGGDCVYALQRHFVDCMLSGAEFESNGPDYLRTVAAVDAIYAAAQSGQSLSYAAFLRELAGAEL